MKKIMGIALLAAGVALASTGPAPARTADADWAALQSAGLLDFKRPAGSSAPRLARQQHSIMMERQFQALREQGLAFYENHPSDPRRWIVVEKMLLRPPHFITSYGPNYENDTADVMVDSTAVAAWRARMDVLHAALSAATDAPVDVRRRVDAGVISRELGSFSRMSEQEAQDADWAPLLSKITAFAAAYPESEQAADQLQFLMYCYEPKNPPEKTAAVWRQFADSPNRSVAEKARQRLRLFDLLTHPLELKFVALDGRTVDLEQMRGKVVLIDFWATWCGPCVAELPNIKRVYSAYHEKGFEVVGVALEDGKITPKDPAERAAEKMAEAKKRLTDFTTANSLPWPQYFDGKYWKTELAVKYGVASIPDMLLIDQAGKLVTTIARGDLLEKEVKRLLKL